MPAPASAFTADAINSVIGCSQRTLVVLTQHYLASEWCRFELRAALGEASADKAHKVIVVLLDPKCLLDLDPEMRALLTTGATGCVGATSQQLVQLDGQLASGQQQDQQLQLLATSKISFLNYNEAKFWPKLKLLMPPPRHQQHPIGAQTLTLTTKN